ncbi:hypothetical protein FS842_005320 [Serendipita sp. 407]|nr:hypothetical protein FRC15_003414 [Serendipita sp. 397]KAG9057616.1 hypothetical protein FS842_005320 [Serendipita sp. 407]
MPLPTEPTSGRTETSAGESSPLLQVIRSYKPEKEPFVTLGSIVTIPHGVISPSSPTVMTDARELPGRRPSPTSFLSLLKDAAPAPENTGSDRTQEAASKSRQSSLDDQANFTSEDEEDVEFVLESTPVPSEVGTAPGRRTSFSNETPTRQRNQRGSVSEASLPKAPSMNSSDGPSNEHFGNGITCRYYNKGSCGKGSACTYSHAADLCSLRSHPEGRNVCLYFIHNNKCRFSDVSCNYSHHRADLEPWDDDEVAKQLDLKLGIRKDTLRASLAMQKGKKSKEKDVQPPEKQLEKDNETDQEKKETKANQRSNQLSAQSGGKKTSRSRHNSVATVSSQERRKGDKKNNVNREKPNRPQANKSNSTSQDAPNHNSPTGGATHPTKASSQTSPNRTANPPLSGGVGLGTVGLLRMSASSPKESSNLLRTGVALPRASINPKGTVGLGVTHENMKEVEDRALGEGSPVGNDKGTPPDGSGRKRKPNKRGYAPPYALAGGSTFPPRWDLPQQLDRLQLLRFGQLNLDGAASNQKMDPTQFDPLAALAALHMRGLQMAAASQGQFDPLLTLNAMAMGLHPVTLPFNNQPEQRNLEEQIRRADPFFQYSGIGDGSL